MIFASAALGQSNITLHTDSYYPFNGDPADPKPGYVIEILKTVFEKTGAKLDYAIVPWKRAVAEAEKGEINGVIGGLKSDTPTFIFPEEPIGMNANGLFVKKGNSWTYTDITSLKGKRLGVINGYSYGDKFDQYVTQNQDNPNVINVSSGDNPVATAIHKLQGGFVDVYVENKTVFWAHVKKVGLDKNDFLDVGNASDPEPMYVAFSPKKTDSKALAEALTTGIRAMRASGELAKILKSYEVNDWAK